MIDMGRIRAVVFDVDGTLYRQGPLRRAILRRLLMHIAARPAGSVRTFRALTAYRRAQEILRGVRVDGPLESAQLNLACKLSGNTPEVVATIVERWMHEEPLRLLERFVEPALRTLLSTARSHGLRLAALSDYPAAAKLEAMRLTEFFEVVVTAQHPAVNCFKPDPTGLALVLSQLGVKADQALYVGDRSDVDARVASAAGVSGVIIVGRRYKSPVRADFAPATDHRDLHRMLFSQTSEAS
jgi:FMN phosphatase YigB (HAD superfamily)